MRLSVPFLLLLLPCMLHAQQNSSLHPWSDSLFGERNMFDGSGYHLAGLNDIRHIGWSWSSIHTMTPTCYTSYAGDDWAMSACAWLEEPCKAVGGSLWGNQICMETTKPFTVVGPDCWDRSCAQYNKKEEIHQTCSDLKGHYVDTGAFGALNGVILGSSWCLVPGRHTVLGPACYGKTCYEDSLREVCSDLKGTVYGDLYCILDSKYTVMGPICRPDDSGECFPEETTPTCEALGGHSLGGVFCVLEGDYSVLGPFCKHVGTNYTECFDEQGIQVCNHFSGTSFGDGLFCAIQGNDYHYYSDFYGGGCLGIGAEGGVCETDFGGISFDSCSCVFQGDYTLGAPTRWDRTGFSVNNNKAADILAFQGYGFILDGSYNVYGPNCYGEICNVDSQGCSKAGGVSVGGIFCAMSTSKRPLLIFTTEAGLPNGIVFIVVLLCILVYIQFMILLVWWRRKWVAAETLDPLDTTKDDSASTSL